MAGKKTGIGALKKRAVCQDCGKKYRKSRGYCPYCAKKSCDVADFAGTTSEGAPCAKCGITKRHHKPPKLAPDVVAELRKQGTGTRVALEQLAPNRWNPNFLSAEKRAKLWLGMVRVLRRQVERGVTAPDLPPVLVRPVTGFEHSYEIIDGEQRWRLLKDNQDHELIKQYFAGVVNIVCVDVDEETARLLTSTMNWGGGEPDPDKYVDYLGELWQGGMTIAESADYLPESEDELRRLKENYDIRVEEPAVPVEDDKLTSADKREDFVELRYVVSIDQADVIRGAIQRVASLLQGKNLEGRALEFICADSLAAPTEGLGARIAALQPPPPPKPEKRKGKKGLKAKLAAAAKADET